MEPKVEKGKEFLEHKVEKGKEFWEHQLEKMEHKVEKGFNFIGQDGESQFIVGERCERSER